MFSGKTVENIRNATMWLDVMSGYGLYINHISDNRDEEHGVSSNSSSFSGISKRFELIKSLTLLEIEHMIERYDVISIDEAQLFPDLEYIVKKWLIRGKHFFISGLLTNWMGGDFGHIKDIISSATTFTFLPAKCAFCRDDFIKSGNTNVMQITDACRTGRLTITDKEVEIGGKDLYVPLCYRHHSQHLIDIHGITTEDQLENLKREIKTKENDKEIKNLIESYKLINNFTNDFTNNLWSQWRSKINNLLEISSESVKSENLPADSIENKSTEISENLSTDCDEVDCEKINESENLVDLHKDLERHAKLFIEWESQYLNSDKKITNNYAFMSKMIKCYIHRNDRIPLDEYVKLCEYSDDATDNLGKNEQFDSSWRF